MSANRPAPRWALAIVCYVVACLAAGLTLSAVENFAEFLGGAPTATSIAGALFQAVLSGAAAGLDCALPAALAGLIFWWFRIESLAAYVIAGLVIAGGLIGLGLNMGFDEIGAIPAGIVGALTFWAMMRVFGKGRPIQTSDPSGPSA